MIDILIVKKLSISQIEGFLSALLNCEPTKVKVFDADQFYSVDELDYSQIDCICVYSEVCGDVAQLLQIFRYKISDNCFLQKLIVIAYRKSILCYIPSDSLNGWYYLGYTATPVIAKEIESENDCYVFKLI